MKNKFITFSIIPLLILFSSCSKDEVDTVPELELSPAQLNLVGFFKQVALSQVGSNSGTKLTHKWRSTMKIFIEGNPTTEHIAKTQQTINEINSLSSDGFFIKLVSDISLSNCQIFFGSQEEYNSKYGDTFPNNNNTSVGLSTFQYRFDNIIDNGVIWVGTNNTNSTQQKGVLLQELTHAIGFRNHAVGRKSVLNYTLRPEETITKYTDIDLELIRLLYHPSMDVGLNDAQVDNILRDILLGE
jgi:DUF2927 family protein